jgi:hypothetical protein
MNTVTLTPAVCEKWIKNRTRHPITGKRIIIGDSTYKFLYETCINNGINIEFCTYKWVKLEDSDSIEYNKSSYVLCNTCKSIKLLFAVHDDDNGEYKCTRCNKDIRLIYKCIKCKRKNERIINELLKKNNSDEDVASD